MATLRGLPAETELDQACMATAIFRVADDRYYTRKIFPAMITPVGGGAQVPCTIGDILTEFLTYETLCVPVGADSIELQSVTLSVYHVTDDSLIASPIGNQADMGIEYTVKALISDAAHAVTEQLRVPAVNDADTFAAWFAANAADIILGNGNRAANVNMTNFSRQRAPRASV